MMKQFWLSLPVKDIQRSVDFFTAMGFSFNPGYPTTQSNACLMLGDKKVVVMLCDASTFKQYTGHAPWQDDQRSEVLLSIDAESKEEVDEIARKAVAAGGSTTHVPYEMKGGMYGCNFNDPDGHKWNVLYMDMTKM